MIDQAPILHYSDWCEYPQVVCTEYPLPGLLIPTEVEAELHPWLLEFIGLESTAAHSFLMRRWMNIAEPCLLSLREFFSQFVPRSIIVQERRGWLFITDHKFTNVQHTPAGDEWFVAPPEVNALQERFRQFDLQRVDCLLPFVLNFGELREILPPIAGGFFPAEEWEHLDSLLGDYIKNVRGYAAWREAVMFWNTSTGDILLLDPSGKLGWFNHEDLEIRPCFNNFPEFINHFAEVIKHRHELTPWSHHSGEEDF